MKKNLIIVVVMCVAALTVHNDLARRLNKVKETATPSKYTIYDLADLKKGDFIQTGYCEAFECNGQLLMVYSVRCKSGKLDDCTIQVMESPNMFKTTWLLKDWLPKVSNITRYNDPHWATLAHLFVTMQM